MHKRKDQLSFNAVKLCMKLFWLPGVAITLA